MDEIEEENKFWTDVSAQSLEKFFEREEKLMMDAVSKELSSFGDIEIEADAEAIPPRWYCKVILGKNFWLKQSGESLYEAMSNTLKTLKEATSTNEVHE